MTDSWKIGFIGAGRMGGPLARRLAAGGHHVAVYDLDPKAAQACLAAGALAAESAIEAARDADAVFTSLPLPEDVIATFESLLPALKPGAVCVDVSTIDPISAGRLEELLDARGLAFVACPLGKTPQHAERGEIPVFVGGPPHAVAAIRPLLQLFAESVHDLGTVQAATTFKLISNLIGMTNVAILAEGYLLAKRAGIAPETFAAALRETGATSFQSDVRLPWIVDDDYAARFSVALATKDLRLALEVAQRWGIPTPLGALGFTQIASAAAHGYRDEDVIAVAKVLDPHGHLLDREGP